MTPLQKNREELVKVCENIGNKKTPGPDGIPNSVLKLAITRKQELFICTLQKCREDNTTADFNTKS